MPQVPRYTDPTVQTIAPSAPQMQGLSPDAFGAGLAQGLKQASGAGFDISQQMQQRANQKAIYNFRAGLDDAQNKTLFAENTDDGEQEGFLTLRGDDALNYLPAYKEDFQTKVDALKATASNDQQREAFDMMAKERMTQLDATMLRHSDDQWRASVDTARQTMIDSSLKTIGNFYNDNNRFNQELSVIQEATRQDIEAKGMSGDPAYVKARLDAVISQATHERLNRMVLVDPMGAYNYIQEHKATDMSSDDVAHFETMLKPKVDAIQTHQSSDAIWSALGPKNDYDPINIDAMQEKARKEISNPDILRDTLTDLQQRTNIRLEGEKQRTTSSLAAVWKAQAAGATLSDIKAMPEFSALPGHEQATVGHTIETWVNSELREARAEARAARSESRQSRIEQRLAVQEQWNQNYMHYNQDPEALASMSEEQFSALYPQLGAANFKALGASRSRLTSPQALATAQVQTQTFNSIMTQAGITDKSKIKEYYDMAQHFVVMQQQETGRKFNPAEIRSAIIAGMTNVDVNQRVSPLGLDTLSYTSTTQKRRMEVEDPNAIIIPPNYLTKINSDLAAAKVQVTPQRQRQMYDAMLGQNTPKGTK